MVLPYIQGILPDEPIPLVQTHALVTLETLSASTAGYNVVLIHLESIIMPSMSNTWLNTMLAHMLTNLIFTINPRDRFYYHLTDVKTKVYGGCLVQGQNADNRQNQDFNPSLLIASPASFLGFSASVSIISLCNVLSLVLCHFTSTSTSLPLSRIFLKFASSRSLCHVSSVLFARS